MRHFSVVFAGFAFLASLHAILPENVYDFYVERESQVGKLNQLAIFIEVAEQIRDRVICNVLDGSQIITLQEAAGLYKSYTAQAKSDSSYSTPQQAIATGIAFLCKYRGLIESAGVDVPNLQQTYLEQIKVVFTKLIPTLIYNECIQEIKNVPTFYKRIVFYNKLVKETYALSAFVFKFKYDSLKQILKLAGETVHSTQSRIDIAAILTNQIHASQTIVQAPNTLPVNVGILQDTQMQTLALQAANKVYIGVYETCQSLIGAKSKGIERQINTMDYTTLQQLVKPAQAILTNSIPNPYYSVQQVTKDRFIVLPVNGMYYTKMEEVQKHIEKLKKLDVAKLATLTTIELGRVFSSSNTSFKIKVQEVQEALGVCVTGFKLVNHVSQESFGRLKQEKNRLLLHIDAIDLAKRSAANALIVIFEQLKVAQCTNLTNFDINGFVVNKEDFGFPANLAADAMNLIRKAIYYHTEAHSNDALLRIYNAQLQMIEHLMPPPDLTETSQ